MKSFSVIARAQIEIAKREGYVFSDFSFPLLNHVLSPETCLGDMYSIVVFQGSLYPFKQARLTPES